MSLDKKVVTVAAAVAIALPLSYIVYRHLTAKVSPAKHKALGSDEIGAVRISKPDKALETLAMVTCSGLGAATYVSFALSDDCLLGSHRADVKALLGSWNLRGVRNNHNVASRISEMFDATDGTRLLESLKAGDEVAIFVDSDLLFNRFGLFQLIADAHLSVVWHVFGSLVDAMEVNGVADFGLIISSSAQECHDMAVLAHVTARLARRPVMHFFHFDVASVDAEVTLLKNAALSGIITAVAARSGSVALDDAFEAASSLLAPSFNRRYRAFEYHGSAAAAEVIVMVGAVLTVHAQDALLAIGGGIVNCRLPRPWVASAFLAALPAGVKRVAVLDVSLGSPVFASVAASFHSGTWGSKDRPLVIGSKLGCGCSALDAGDIEKLIANLNTPEPAKGLEVGCVSSVLPLELPARSHSVSPFAALLHEAFGARLQLLDAAEKSSVSECFGEHVERLARRDRLAVEVRRVLSSSKALPKGLARDLKEWLEICRDSVLATVVSDRLLPEILSNSASLPILAPLVELQASFWSSSHWIIAGNSWAYDESYANVHDILTQDKPVKILLLDGGRGAVSRGRDSKKNLGVYAMQLGGVYVASIALGAGKDDAARAALQEADAHLGPALVLAFAACETDPEDAFSEANALEASRLAVLGGEWPLYRWNPTYNVDESDRDPLTLDSEVLQESMQAFLSQRNQLSILTVPAPLSDAELGTSLESDILKRHHSLAVEAMAAGELVSSFDKLNGALSRPICVLYASDSGKAEGMAKLLAAEGKKRGLNVIDCVAMDDLEGGAAAIAGLEEGKCCFLFSVATAGQGEMPHNGSEFWKALQRGGLDLSNVEYSVFALGDSHYWEEKKYYCKSGRDLDSTMTMLGAKALVPLGLGDDQDADGPSEGYAKWEKLVWAALGVPDVEKIVEEKEEGSSKTDDGIKVWSNYLRGTIAEGLKDNTTGALVFEDTKITKFHGIYMQDDRDTRTERRKLGIEKAFSFMVRVGLPGGVGTADQWLAFDDMSDRYGNGDFKITTRQAFQLHGIIKRKLKAFMQAVNRAAMTSLAACGDVNRNTLASPTPQPYSVHSVLLKTAKDIDSHLKPRTGAYHEIWLDKHPVAGGPVDEEPMYGKTYLPRKFKIAFAVPPVNDTDVYGQGDMGYIAIVEGGSIVGYNVVIGGGMGMTHSNKETYPCLAQDLGFCRVDQAVAVAEKVLLVQRDYGERLNRKHARMKYTLRDKGLDWYRSEVERRLGFKLQPARPFKFTTNGDQYGWKPCGDGDLWSYTMYIQNGRVIDRPDYKMRTGLREAAKAFRECSFNLTANQNLSICNVPSFRKAELESLLKAHGIRTDEWSGLKKNSMACVALPTCALALAESERYLPTLVDKLEVTLTECGLRETDIVIRMTGCPNGCARPYLAEIAFVGRAPGIYNLYLGGGFAGQRLAKLYKEAVDEAQILSLLEPILRQYGKARLEGEHFGDFVIRAGYVNATVDGPDFHMNLKDIVAEPAGSLAGAV